MKAINVPIVDITPFTMQDFVNHLACILWFKGCNMRCQYCHNKELVLGKIKVLNFEKIFNFLKQRRNFLEGVVLSGGECTLSKKIVDLIKIIKDLGYKVKIDTNGANPDVLLFLIENKLIEYVALDYKAPQKKLYDITKYNKFEKINHSLKILCKSNINFEVRTTIHTNLLDENDINEMMAHLDKVGFNKIYYLQNYKDADVIGNLNEQVKILEKNNLYKPKNYKIDFRNFGKNMTG